MLARKSEQGWQLICTSASGRCVRCVSSLASLVLMMRTPLILVKGIQTMIFPYRDVVARTLVTLSPLTEETSSFVTLQKTLNCPTDSGDSSGAVKAKKFNRNPQPTHSDLTRLSKFTNTAVNPYVADSRLHL
jgi:hypothetical protein